MTLSLAALLGGPYSVIYLFFLTICASYITIPTMGIIIVSFGAAAANVPNLILLMLAVYAATLIGDITLFFIARRFSEPVLRFLKRFKWFSKNEKKSRVMFKKYGFYAVFISRFLNTELCVLMNYISGFEKFDSKKFITAVIIGEFIYATVYPIIGYIFKDTWNYVLGLVQNFIWIIIIILLVWYLIHKTIKIARAKRKR